MKAFSGKQFAIIGADNIGRILLERPRQSGVPAEQLSLCDSAAEHATNVGRRLGVQVAGLHDDAVCQADVWLLATPPASSGRFHSHPISQAVACKKPAQGNTLSLFLM